MPNYCEIIFGQYISIPSLAGALITPLGSAGGAGQQLEDLTCKPHIVTVYVLFILNTYATSKRKWHSSYVLVYIGPLLTYLKVYIGKLFSPDHASDKKKHQRTTSTFQIHRIEPNPPPVHRILLKDQTFLKIRTQQKLE